MLLSVGARECANPARGAHFVTPEFNREVPHVAGCRPWLVVENPSTSAACCAVVVRQSVHPLSRASQGPSNAHRPCLRGRLLCDSRPFRVPACALDQHLSSRLACPGPHRIRFPVATRFPLIHRCRTRRKADAVRSMRRPMLSAVSLCVPLLVSPREATDQIGPLLIHPPVDRCRARHPLMTASSASTDRQSVPVTNPPCASAPRVAEASRA